MENFNDSGSIQRWHELKREYNLNESPYFQWLQLIESNAEDGDLLSNKTMKMLIMLKIHDNCLIKGSRVIAIYKLTLTEICSILVSKVQNKPFFNISNVFIMTKILAVNTTYMLPRLATYNTYM